MFGNVLLTSLGLVYSGCKSDQETEKVKPKDKQSLKQLLMQLLPLWYDKCPGDF